MITKAALIFAKEKHKNQNRKVTNDPYVNHPISVAKILRENKKSHKIKELVAAAFLHDTLEDTNTTEHELEKLFGKLITSLVLELTTDEKEKEKIGKEKYLAEKMSDNSRMSNWALVIKLADRLDNVSDLKNADEKFRKRYTKETRHILETLEKNRKLSSTHKKLIKKIEEKLNE